MKWGERMTNPFKRYDSACIDGAFLRVSRQVISVRLPHREEKTLKLRGGSAALIFAAAALVSMQEQPARARRAVLALLAPLGFRPETYLKRRPVIDRPAWQGMTGVQVRDGSEERLYFCEEPQRLLAACACIWDGQERGITQEDQRAVAALPAGTRAFATAQMTPSGPTPLTYLGSLTVGDVPAPEALEALFALWDTGFPVSILADGTPLPPELPVVATLPERCLHVPYAADVDFAQPILAYLQRRQRLRRRLPRACTALGVTVLLTVGGTLFLRAVHASPAQPLTWVFAGLCAALAGLSWFTVF